MKTLYVLPGCKDNLRGRRDATTSSFVCPILHSQVVIRLCVSDDRSPRAHDIKHVLSDPAEGEVTTSEAHLPLFRGRPPETKPGELPPGPRTEGDGEELDVPPQREVAPVDEEEEQDGQLRP